MDRQILTEQVRRKWEPIVNHKALPEIKDSYRKHVTTVLLENQERFLRESGESLQGVLGTNLGVPFSGGSTTGIDSFDPILISLVRRAMPNLMAYDIAGVQPMNGPTGLIFAMKSRYGVDNGKAVGTTTDGRGARDGDEALFSEARTGYAGDKATQGTAGDMFAADIASGTYGIGRPMPTTEAERLGAPGETQFNEMTFTIEKTAVTAKTRALKAEYTTELAQDLKAVHGLDAETELANILSTEIMFEINRELVRTIYEVAKLGAQQEDLAGRSTGGGLNGAGGGGIYDLELDSDGRWSAEKFRGLVFQIERECNTIGGETRRGKGNIVLVSPDVASALSMAGILDFSAITYSGGLNTDVNQNTFAGTMSGGRIKVYIDPYSIPTHIDSFEPVNYVCVGYKGTSPYDAGIFYCPYVPLQMVRAVDTSTFQPKIGFKTRYGLISNPYVLESDNRTPDAEKLTRRRNQYYRIFRVDNIHGSDAGVPGI
jgi:hypothetical protein